MTKNNSLSGKTQEIWKFCQNAGNFGKKKPKTNGGKPVDYPDYKDHGYYYIFSETSQNFSQIFPKKNPECVCQVS